MMKNKKTLTVSFALVIAVIAILVFITIYLKPSPAIENSNVDLGENTNMQQETNNEPVNTQTETSVGKTSTVGGVKITVLSEGKGDPVKSGDVIAMNYTGTLSDGTVFDSNVDPKFNHVEPFVFELGAGQVIKGWDVGVSGMKLGEKRKLVISPDYGYGEKGAGGAIPPNATLVFEVQLIGIKQ